MRINYFSLFYFFRFVKNLLIKDEVKYLKTSFGICKGYYLPINFTHDTMMYLGLFECEIAKYIKRYVTKGSCCYDVGSAEGYYICAFHRFSKYGEIYCFEPDYQWKPIILELLKVNGITTVKYFQKIIGGIVSNDGKVVTIDYLVFQDNVTPPDVIKVDIEGGEYILLCGAEKTIDRFHPRLIIETHSRELEEKCQLFLKEKGYQSIIVKNRLFIRETRLIHNRWLCAKYNP